jgi:helix-turn-helix protein
MTQIETLKAAFDRGESLTVAEALTRFGIYALSQRVGQLDRSGYPVEHEMVTLPSGKRVARYSKFRVAYG